MLSRVAAVSKIGIFKNVVGSTIQKQPLSSHHNRDYLKERLVEIIPATRTQITEFKKQHSEKIIDSVNVGQVFGGMRDIKSLYHEPSLLDPQQGIRFRGLTCADVKKKLTTAEISQPLPEAMFWLLLTGEVPTAAQISWLSKEWARRAELPAYLINLINGFPDNLHPMAQLSAAMTILSRFSKFSVTYNIGGVPKTELWKPMYEDCMNLIAKVPVIAALIYRNSYHDGSLATIDSERDWAANYANMLGVNTSPDFIDYMRLYLVLHADHEGGNASSHTAHLVGSTLSDAFLSYSAAMNALAGPLHGRANQKVMEWINNMTSVLGLDMSDEKLTEFVKDAISKSVIPGYGHAVLRVTDTRFTELLKFAQQRLPDNRHVQIVESLLKIVPDILKDTVKVKNPWPNVDAVTGVIFNELKLPEMEYYTVPFGVSRSLGICAALIWSRALSLPIERPKSLDMNALISMVK